MWDFVKGIFGKNDNCSKVDDTLWNNSDYSNQSRPSESFHSFQVFTNPIEIHKFFEQQMNEMMKGMFGFGNLTSHPWGEDFQDHDNRNPADLRDSILKPGYSDKELKGDGDLDGQIDFNDVERFFGKPHPSDLVPPIYNQPQYSFRSVSVRTVRRPDGTVETEKTVRDHTGREETTVTTQGPSPSLYLPTTEALIDDHSDESLLSKFFSF